MDTETNTIENESKPVESSEPINENGCDDNEKQKVIETVTQQPNDKDTTDQSTESENDQKLDDDSESSPTKSPDNESPIILAASETTPDDIIDSENPTENDSPEKNANATTPAVETTEIEPKEVDAVATEAVETEAVATEATEEIAATEVAPCNVSIPSVEVDDVDEPVNDKNWNQINSVQLESSLEKSDSNLACLIPSPSDPINDSVNEKDDSWDRLNEPIDDANYDDSDDDDDEDSGDGAEDNEFNKSLNPKTVEQKKSNNDCQVFELTDDNSSVDDTRESDGEDDIDGDDMGEEEEEEEDDDDVSGKYFFIYWMLNQSDKKKTKNKQTIWKCFELIIIIIDNVCMSFHLTIEYSDSNEIHNIDDSDDEIEAISPPPQRQQQQQPKVLQLSSPYSVKLDLKPPKMYVTEYSVDDHSSLKDDLERMRNIKPRQYLKFELLKQGASRLQRNLAVKRSIKWYVMFLCVCFFSSSLSFCGRSIPTTRKNFPFYQILVE